MGEAQGREGLTMHCGAKCSFLVKSGDVLSLSFSGEERRRNLGFGGMVVLMGAKQNEDTVQAKVYGHLLKGDILCNFVSYCLHPTSKSYLK